ncbi:uncharacterized protein LOC143012121 [Genypterus blacodes]|uniref:uncharacterized protein LOC143012121 n=1 Tax=Genypterus blacodes TaxID=154954 RepID=UPI003F76ADF0
MSSSVYRAQISERRSSIETMHTQMEKLQEEITAKQNSVTRTKEQTKSLKGTYSLLCKSEKTLKADLERRREICNHDMEVYEARIVNYRKTYEEHKEYFYENPLAQKLLKLQAEKENLERQLEACEDQIKQKQLETVLGQPAGSSSEKPQVSVSAQPLLTEWHKPLDVEAEIEDPHIGIASLHLSQAKGDPQISEEVNANAIYEGSKTPAYSSSSEGENYELWSNQTSNDQIRTEDPDQGSGPDQMPTEDQGQGCGLDSQVSTISSQGKLHLSPHKEQQSAASRLGEDVEERVATEEVQAPLMTDVEESEGVTMREAQHPSAQGFNPQSSQESAKTDPSTPIFPFNCSPSSSSCEGTLATKSPAFLFSLDPDSSTPSFSGFGFNRSSPLDEVSSFSFPGSIFKEKKPPESKSSTGLDFLFDQPERNEDFKFFFTAESPQSATAEQEKKRAQEFPFSFNF